MKLSIFFYVTSHGSTLFNLGEHYYDIPDQEVVDCFGRILTYKEMERFINASAYTMEAGFVKTFGKIVMQVEKLDESLELPEYHCKTLSPLFN